MSYLPADLPVPEPSPDERPYFEACRHQELRIQRCSACGRFRHPPHPFCAACGSGDTEWARVSGNGTVFTYTIAYHPTHKALRDAVPYNVVVVLLDDADDVRIVSNLIDAEPGEIRIGMKVELVFEEARDGWFLPRFRRRDAAAAASL